MYTPITHNDLMLTNGVYSLFRADKGTKTETPYCVEHFPTRECLETFETEAEARDFFNECCLSTAQGRSTNDAETTVSLTMVGMFAVAGLPLAA